MSLMQAQRQGERYPKTTLLKSSKDLGWSTLLAELHSHGRYEGPGAAAPTHADVGIIVRGSDEGLLTYKFAGSWQSTRPTTGSIHLRPIGVNSDEVRSGQGKISIASPVGKAVYQHRAGDEVEIEAPSGTFRVRIDNIKSP